MSTDGPPPARPPMLSPDGKWVWNGQQWIPVAGPNDGGHSAVFSAWNQVHAQVAYPPPPAVQPRPVHVMPQILAAMEVTPRDEIPLWEQAPPSRRGGMMRAAAAGIGVLVAIVFIAWVVPILYSLYGGGSAPEQTVAAATLPPLKARSERARADRFVTGALTPAMTSLDQSAVSLTATCVGLSISCQDTLNAMDKEIKNSESAIDRGPVPTCLATTVGRVRLDLTAMDAAVQASLKAYTDNVKAELIQGVARLSAASRPLLADRQAVAAAEATQCDTQLVGP